MEWQFGILTKFLCEAWESNSGFVLQEFEAVPVISIIWNHSVIINSVCGWRTNMAWVILHLLRSLSGASLWRFLHLNVGLMFWKYLKKSKKWINLTYSNQVEIKVWLCKIFSAISWLWLVFCHFVLWVVFESYISL